MPLPNSLQSIVQRHRAKPESEPRDEEVEQGDVLWLGTMEETVASNTSRGNTLFPIERQGSTAVPNKGMFNHPILVVSRPASNSFRILFLPMTSLGDHCLDTRFKGHKSSYHQQTYLPVAPAPPHPRYTTHKDTRYRTLTFEEGMQLEKPTYVNVRELYEMDWRDAQRYNRAGESPERKPWKLDDASRVNVVALAEKLAGLKRERQYDSTVAQQRRRWIHPAWLARVDMPTQNFASDSQLLFYPPPVIDNRSGIAMWPLDGTIYRTNPILTPSTACANDDDNDAKPPCSTLASTTSFESNTRTSTSFATQFQPVTCFSWSSPPAPTFSDSSSPDFPFATTHQPTSIVDDQPKVPAPLTVSDKGRVTEK